MIQNFLMNIEFLLLFKKHTDTMTEQTKPKRQETLEFKLKNQMETFSYFPPISLSEERTWVISSDMF